MRHFVFNDINFENDLRILGVSKLLASSRRVLTKSFARIDFISGIKQGNLTEIIIKAGIIALTKPELHSKKRQLFGKLATNKPKKLILSEDPSVFYWAIFDGELENEKFDSFGRVNLRFWSEDGIAYSLTEKVAALTGINDGTMPAKPILKITVGSATKTINITNGSVNAVLYKDNNFSAGDVIMLDMSGRKTKAMLNGVVDQNIISDMSKDDLFTLPVGSWTISANPTQTIETRYHERFL